MTTRGLRAAEVINAVTVWQIGAALADILRPRPRFPATAICASRLTLSPSRIVAWGVSPAGLKPGLCGCIGRHLYL